ncbi:MAG TPA: PspC domain-containing protein, partial [Candidatus Limnocylindria bacterium]
IDATFVRVVMVILAFPFGVGVLIYFVLLFLMPNPGEATPFVRSAGVEQTAAVDPLNPVAPAAPRATDPMIVERRRNGIGLLLVAVGVVFLLGTVGAFRFIDWHYIWPLVLIALGVYLVAQRTRQ